MLNNQQFKTLYLTFSAMLVACSIFAQPIVQYKAPPAQRDNLRVVNNLDIKLNRALSGNYIDIELAAREILKISSAKTPNHERLNYLSNQYVKDFYNIAKSNAKTELYHMLYSAVLPFIWFESQLQDASYYSKISQIYRDNYNACLNTPAVCNFDKAGSAVLFLGAYNKESVNLSHLLSLALNEKVPMEDRLAFMQYAAPVLAHNGGKVHFEEMIQTLAARTKHKNNMQGGFVDFFVLVNIIDGGYNMVKESCTHQEGFVKGFCGQFGGNEFKQYKEPIKNAAVQKYYIAANANIKTIKRDAYAYAFSEPQEPMQLATTIMLYAEFYGDDVFWEDAFTFLLNAKLPGSILVASYRDAALAKLLLAAPPSTQNVQLKNYIAARINNNYFALDKDETLDAQTKAVLKDELGLAYRNLTNYNGLSPINVVSDEGYLSQIKFTGNANDIEGFWAGMFNFKEAPAQALSNVFIVGLASKGLVKNSDKIFAGIAALIQTGGNFAKSIPAVITTAKAQLSALRYLGNRQYLFMPAYTGLGTNTLSVGTTLKLTAKSGPGITIARPIGGIPLQNQQSLQQNLMAKYKDIAAIKPAANTSPVAQVALMPQKPVQPSSITLNIGEDGKRFGYAIFRKVFRMPSRTALNKLYSWGAQPTMFNTPKLSDKVYKISNLDAFTSANGAYVPYKYTVGRQYLFRGMALNGAEVKNIMLNGIRKIDMPKNNMAILSAMATPGTNIQSISLSPYAWESAKYATIGLNPTQGIPTLVHIKGITKAVSVRNAHGVFTGTDITADKLVRTSVMLNIEGKAMWGQLQLKSDNFLFTPYIAK